MKLTYIGPHDEVEIPDVGVVAHGASIDVPDDLAGRPPADASPDEDGVTDLGEGLLAQPSNWVPAGGLDTLTIPELRAHAEERGIDVSALGKRPAKKKLIAAIEAFVPGDEDHHDDPAGPGEED